MGGPFITQVARSTPFDNSSNDFEALETQSAVEELDFRQVVKEPTGFLDRTQSQMSFDNVTRTFSIAVKAPATEFVYYIRGHRYAFSTTQTVTITDTEGLWFIYFDGATLIASLTPWDFEQEVAFVALICWDATNKEQILIGEERHGLVMDWATHKRLHRVVNSQLEKGSCKIGNYILRGNGTLDAHVQYSVADGYLHDEDIIMHIKHAASPANDFEQILSPIAYLPVCYRANGGGGDWRKIAATSIPVAYNGTGLQYNHYDSGTDTWSLQNVTDGWFTTYWVLVTNDITAPVHVIVGQTQASDAITSATDTTLEELLAGLPLPEVVGVSKLIYQYSSSFTNTPKAILYELVDVTDINLDFDRYNFIASYGGNANTGRYLEVFPAVDSLEAPFTFPENSFIRTITFHSSALNTGTIGFYLSTDLVNPVFEITITNSNSEVFVLTEYFSSLSKLVVKVSSGAFSKPNLRLFVQTQIN